MKPLSKESIEAMNRAQAEVNTEILNCIKKRKTTAELCDQDRRISKLSFSNSVRRIEQLHPATGGNHMLTNNWGNEAAREILAQYMERQSKLFNAFRTHYKESFKAEYPNHILNQSN